MNERGSLFKPKLSVIIVTRGRAGQLTRCLESLLLQNTNLIVDYIVGVNGTDDSTVSSLCCLEERFPGNLTVKVFSETLTPGEARNGLLPLARGAWIYFIDDDAFAERGLFERFEWLIKTYPHGQVFGGPNLTPRGSSLFQEATGAALSSRFATYFSSPRYSRKSDIGLCGEEKLILCNLFVKREVLGSKPFAPNLICAEENFFLRNIQQEKGILIYDSNLYVWHERRARLTELLRQVFKYGYGRGQLSKFKINHVKLAHLVPSLSVIYAVSTLGLIVSGHLSREWLWPFLVYVILCPWGSITASECRSFLARALSTFIFPAIHASYGAGLLLGLIRG